MFKKGLRHLVLVFLSILTSLTAEAQNVTLSNNLLYDAMLTPNLNIGYAPDSTTHWSYGLTVGFNPWPRGNLTKHKWRHLLLSPEVRYWKNTLKVGHFFGANFIYSHFNAGYTDFVIYKGVKSERRQGDLVALGAFYGYSWVLGRHWNLEALIGVAVGYAKYDRYACGHCGTKISDESNLFLMPQAGINIVYNIPGRPCKQQEPVAIDPNAQETLRQLEKTDNETTKTK